jgi:hypothetical protein
MEELRNNIRSKKASNVSPHILSVLEEHADRIIRLEALILLNRTSEILTIESPQQPVVKDDIEIIEEVIDNEIEIDELEHIIEPEIINPLIAELNEKLSQLANENVILNDEIDTLGNIEDEMDDTMSDNQSVCTEACREMLADADIVKCGKWRVNDEMCNGCIKVNAKSYRKEKKIMDKQRAKELKEVKEKQKQLIKIEQRTLATRLKNIKKSRPEDYGIDTTKQEQMKAELRKLADAYQKGESTNSNFRIQMYL